MRIFVCRASFVLCLACVGMVFVAFVSKTDHLDDMDKMDVKPAISAMTLWLCSAWVFAIINYSALSGSKPPMTNFATYVRVILMGTQYFMRTIAEDIKPFWPKSIWQWIAVAILIAILSSLLMPVLQNST